MSACTIVGLCRLSGISRQGFYRKKTHREQRQCQQCKVVALIREYRQMHPRMGTRKLQHELHDSFVQADVRIGRDRLFKLLADNDLLVKPKRRSVRTTYSDHSLPVYRNLLNEREPSSPNQVWVADITYIDTDEGFMYLSLLTDLYSRKIVGWHLAENLQAKQSIKAVEMAISELPNDRWPIHHSDRGSQYCCHEYVHVLNQRGISISMTEQNHCYENAYAERVNGILKDEYYLDLRFRNREQAKQASEQAINLYNHHRPHLALDMKKPDQVHQLAA